MNWDDSFLIGIAEIDEQHRKVVDIINKVYRAIRRDEGHEAFVDVFTDLSNYAIYHFRTEERYFDKFKYEDTDAHKKDHEAYTKKIVNLRERYTTDGPAVGQEIINFMGGWWQNHICVTDKKYVACFKQNGL